MSTPRRKQLHINTVSVNLGCSCRRPRLSSIFTPKQKTKTPLKYQKHHNFSSSSTTSSSEGKTGISTSPFSYVDPTTSSSSPSSSSSSGRADAFGRVGPKTVAVEKESSDPYLDFRQSMLQMIVENEMRSKDDLKQLLNCFLQLNSPSLHAVILRVFTEIWNSFFFTPPPSKPVPDRTCNNNNYYGSGNIYPSPRFYAPTPKSFSSPRLYAQPKYYEY